jgi:AcrR family transcriptional regulator
MRDTTSRILDASIKIFKEKGYLSATTKAIALEAGVAEITLYRKFKTKKALFEATLRTHLNVSMKDSPISPNVESHTFVASLLENRLERMSRQRAFILLLIQETLSDALPDDLQFDSYVKNHLRTLILAHLDYQDASRNLEKVLRIIMGILLSYIIVPTKTPFYALDDTEKKSIVKSYTESIIVAIKR